MNKKYTYVDLLLVKSAFDTTQKEVPILCPIPKRPCFHKANKQISTRLWAWKHWDIVLLVFGFLNI